jgi:hypothetical protein
MPAAAWRSGCFVDRCPRSISPSFAVIGSRAVQIDYSEPFACSSVGKLNHERLTALHTGICDWNLLLAFYGVDGCVQVKRREPSRRLIKQVAGK